MDVAMERSRGGAGAEAGDAPDSVPTRPAQEGLQDPTAFSSGTKHPAVQVRLRDAQTPVVTAHHLGAASLVLCRHAESLPWRGVTGHGWQRMLWLPGREAAGPEQLSSLTPPPPPATAVTVS